MTFKQKIFYGFSTAILSTTLAFTAVAQDPESLIKKTQSSIKESTHFYHKLHDDHLLGTKILAVVRSLPTLTETIHYLRNKNFDTLKNPLFLQEMIESYSFTQIDTRLYEPMKDTSMVDLVFHGLNFVNLFYQTGQWGGATLRNYQEGYGFGENYDGYPHDMTGDILTFMAINDILINDPSETVEPTQRSNIMRPVFWAVAGTIAGYNHWLGDGFNHKLRYLSSLLLLDDRLFGHNGNIVQQYSNK